MISAQSKLRLEIERPADPGELVNLVQNPSGDLGAWGYNTPVAGSVLRSSEGRLVYTSPGSAASYFTTEPMPVVAGDYALAAWIAEAVTGYYRASIEWLDADGVLLSTTAATGYLTASATRQNYGAFLAPASTAYSRLRFDHYANTSGGHPAAAATMSVHQVTLASSDVSAALAVNRTNLLPDPSGELATGWTSPDDAGITSVTAQHYVGAKSLRVIRTDSAGVLSLVSPAVVITPGRDVALQARVRPGATLRVAAVKARWIDAANKTISAVTADTVTEVAGTWSLAAGVLTAPSNATKVRLQIQYGAKAALNEVHYADAMMIEQAGQVLAYFDGDTPDAGGVVYSWAGTPHASVSSAAANATLGELSPVQWLNILGPTRDISVPREGLNAGSLLATIHDVDLDPAQADIIRPGRRVRLTTATGEVIFTGKALNAAVKYELLAKDAQKRARITLTAVDPVQTLAAAPRSEGVAEIADLPYVLEGAGVPWSVNGSGDQVPTATVVATNGNASAVDQLVVTRDTNLGYAWVDRNGVVQAWDRVELPATPVALLDEDVYNTAIDIDYDTDRCINAVTVVVLRQVATTGVTEEVPYGPYRDEDSVREWGEHAESFTVQGFTGDDAAVEAAAAAYAAEILALNAVPALRVNSVQIPIQDPDDLAYALLDLYDPVTVVNDRAGVSEVMRITRLEHTITAEKWLLTVGFSVDGSVAPSLSTATPPPGAGTIRDDVIDVITTGPGGLDEIYAAADAAAAAAAAAALNATTAQTTANGKNKVTYSLSAPGSTANAAGDIWFQKESATQTIIGQWEGLGGTSWSQKTLNDQVIANLDAGKLVAGSAFINALWIKTNLTLGDASVNGAIQSHNFAGSSVGVYIDKFGLVAKGGSIAGATITGGVVKTGDASARVQMLNAANPLEAGNVWGLIEFYNNLGWNPGRIWASESGTEGTLRISSPHSGSSTDHARAAAVTLISEAGGSRRMNLYAGQMEFTANRYNFTSDNGTAIDFRLFNSGGEFSIMDNNGSGAGVGNIKLGLLGGPNFQHQLSVRTNSNARHSLDVKCSAFGVNLRDSGGGIGAWLSAESSGAQAAQVFGGGGQMALSFLGTQLRVTSWNWESYQPIAASAFNVNSDMRQKTSLVPVTGALDALHAMPVYDYDTPNGQAETATEAARLLDQPRAKLAKVRFRQRGILAQDLAKVVRHAVYDDDTSSKSGMQVDLYGLLSTTIAAVQELDAKVEALSA